MGIRDKASKARSGSKGKVDTKPPAKTDAKASPADKPTAAAPKPEPKPSAVAVAEAPAEKVATVTDISAAAVDRLSDEEVEKFLAAQASGRGVAGLVATRETKRNQIQYDGVTADGFIVRVWAPEGAPMVIKASLEIVE